MTGQGLLFNPYICNCALVAGKGYVNIFYTLVQGCNVFNGNATVFGKDCKNVALALKGNSAVKANAVHYLPDIPAGKGSIFTGKGMWI